MNVPGSNILSMALRVIQPQTLQHYAYTSRAVNSVGDFVDTFAAPVAIQGSFQAINKKLYQELGLNIAKNYSMLITSANVQVTGRDRTGDRVTFAGRTWLAESDQNWGSVDGWRKILCVEVPA